MLPAPDHRPSSGEAHVAEIISLTGVSDRFIEDAEAQVQAHVASFMAGGTPAFVPVSPVDDEVARFISQANKTAAHPLSERTWEAYAQVVRQYCRFALYRRPQLSVLPVEPDHLGAFLEWLASAHIDPETGQELTDSISVSRLDTVMAAIDKFHDVHDFPLPSRHQGIRRWRQRKARDIGRAARHPKRPIELELFVQLVETTLAPYPTGIRDRALALAMAQAGAVASRLATLRWSEVTVTEGGVILGNGADDLQLPRQRAGVLSGEVFAQLRSLSKDPRDGHVFGMPAGNYDNRHLAAEGVSQQALSAAAKRLADAAGVDWRAGEGWDDHGLAQVLELIPDRHPLDVRDHCLLVVGWQTALRRSNLSALNWADCFDADDGVNVTRRFAKNDQAGIGNTFHLVSGTKNPLLDPSATMRQWAATVRFLTGKDPWTELEKSPVFTRVTRSGRLYRVLEPMSHEAIAKVVKRRVAQVGLDPAEYAAHSLRAGVLTSLARAGVHYLKMMELSEHKDVETLLRYVRMGRGRDDNPIHELGL